MPILRKYLTGIISFMIYVLSNGVLFTMRILRIQGEGFGYFFEGIWRKTTENTVNLLKLFYYRTTSRWAIGALSK